MPKDLEAFAVLQRLYPAVAASRRASLARSDRAFFASAARGAGSLPGAWNSRRFSGEPHAGLSPSSRDFLSNAQTPSRRPVESPSRGTPSTPKRSSMLR